MSFFYRNIRIAEILTCEGNEDCYPEAGQGYKCAACRMKKCRELGMTNKGIKRGRYSYQKKASLQKRNANTKENIPSHCAVTPADSMRDKPYLELSESQEFGGIHMSNGEKLNCCRNDDTNDSNSETVFLNRSVNVSSVSSRDPGISSTSNFDYECQEKETGQENSVDDSLTPGEMLAIVKRLGELYSRYPQYPPEFFNKVRSVQQQFLETKNMKRMVFGRLNRLPDDEFFEIYEKIGIDIDGRLANFTNYYPVLEESCLKYIQFARELPDFSELEVEDQTALLKGTKMSFWMLDDFRAIDVQRGLYTCENYETFTKQEIGHIFSEAYASNLFKLGEELQKLSLTSDAVNTLRAFVIFNPVFTVTQRGRARIAAQRSSLLQILTYLFKTNGSDGNNGGAPVVNKLIEIEKEFIKLDEEHTVRWMYIWNSYRPLVTDVFKTTDTPAMRTLSLCHE